MNVNVTNLEAYVEQIARDTATLKMDDTFHVPSREFYEERIRLYREAAMELLNGPRIQTQQIR